MFSSVVEGLDFFHIIRRITAIFLAISQFFASNPCVICGGERALPYENWSASQKFTADYAVTLTKSPERDFVILNLADIQLSDDEMQGESWSMAKQTIDRLVAEVQPDLITLTGDNAEGVEAYKTVVALLDSYGIPWAPVMGNHDGEGTDGEDWCAWQLLDAENCLFRVGPEGMGHGNYIINIEENGDIIHTLYMMDTHSVISEPGINGSPVEGQILFNHLWTPQLQWYEWGVRGVEELAGHGVQSSVIMHIPVVEYRDAWAVVGSGKLGRVKEEYNDIAFGVNGEGSWGPPENNGFFALCKELGSTKDMLCGHDHMNDYSVLYEGIRLTYALKTGPGRYWDETLNGGTVLTINSHGETTLEHHFVPVNELVR